MLESSPSRELATSFATSRLPSTDPESTKDPFLPISSFFWGFLRTGFSSSFGGSSSRLESDSESSLASLSSLFTPSSSEKASLKSISSSSPLVLMVFFVFYGFFGFFSSSLAGSATSIVRFWLMRDLNIALNFLRAV
jgi:hypothetical protein